MQSKAVYLNRISFHVDQIYIRVVSLWLELWLFSVPVALVSFSVYPSVWSVAGDLIHPFLLQHAVGVL